MSNTRLNFLEMRLQHLGGPTPLDRMIKQKQQSLKAALKDSYQSEIILTLPEGEEVQCLINPDTLAQDYDTKIISIPFDAGFHEGTTFFWDGTNTYWIVLLQELTEKAFFKGFIKRCEKHIVINDNEYWFYIKGPTQTSARWKNFSGTYVSGYDDQIEIIIAKNADTLETFKKFETVTIDGNNWKVEAVDSVSSEFLLEVSLKESANTPLKDLETKIIVPEINTAQPHIAGPLVVSPYDIVSYMAFSNETSIWSLDSKKAKIIAEDGKSVQVEIISGKSGSFELQYGSLTLPVVIESI